MSKYLKRFSVPLSVLCLAVTAASCKTTGNSGKSSIEMGDMTTTAPDPRLAKLYSYRMGMTVDAATGGVKVASLLPTRFAEVIGLRAGDVITALNAKPTPTAEAFEQVATAYARGDSTAAGWDGKWVFTVQRSGGTQTVQAQAAYECDPYALIGCGPLPSK